MKMTQHVAITECSVSEHVQQQRWTDLLVSTITQLHFIRFLLWTSQNGKYILLKSEAAVTVERQNMCKLQLNVLKICCNRNGYN